MKPVPLPKYANTWAAGIAFDPDGKKLAVTLQSESERRAWVYLVDAVQGQVLRQIEISSTVFKIGFTPDSSLALISTTPARPDGSMSLRANLLDGVDLHSLWQKDLTEVAYSTETHNETDPSAGRYLFPAQVFSPDFSKMYIVAADQAPASNRGFPAQNHQQSDHPASPKSGRSTFEFNGSRSLREDV